MNATEFKNLKFGNVITRNCDGAKFMVGGCTRNKEGVIHASLVPSISEVDAATYSLTATDFTETVMQGRTILGE